MTIRFPEPPTIHCPHCRVAFVREWNVTRIGIPADADRVSREIHDATCPSCHRHIIKLVETVPHATGDPDTVERIIHPRSVGRPPVPTGVPQPIVRDYTEAAAVLTDSPRASAALSRRCLQNLLVEKAGVKCKNLDDQIQEVFVAGDLPTKLGEDLDAARVVGNFGAHPIKSKSTGEIVEVEPGEAEWNLEILDALFDFFYVQEEKRQQRRDALNAKLKDAGKKPLR